MSPKASQSSLFPVLFEDVTQMVMSFDVDSAAVNRLLPRDLRAKQFGYGTAEMFIQWQSTPRSGLGNFSEILIGFVVEEPYYRSPAAYFHLNPVSTEHARRLGAELWGLEKFLARIESTITLGEQRSRMYLGDDFVLGLSGPVLAGGCEPMGALACARGSLRSTVFRYRQCAQIAASQPRPREARLELGEHPLSAQLAQLVTGRRMKRYTYRAATRLLLGPPLAEILVHGNDC